MANSEVLREMQARLSAHLLAARGAERGRGWLAVECGGAGLLLPLAGAAEITPFRGCVAVAHTRRWFLGVANLRGELHGVVDLADFLGLSERSDGSIVAGGWLVSLDPRLQSHAALRVDALAGLRHEEDLQCLQADDAGSGGRPAFAGARFRDVAATGRDWQEIGLAELARHPDFLDIFAAS